MENIKGFLTLYSKVKGLIFVSQFDEWPDNLLILLNKDSIEVTEA